MKKLACKESCSSMPHASSHQLAAGKGFFFFWCNCTMYPMDEDTHKRMHTLSHTHISILLPYFHANQQMHTPELKIKSFFSILRLVISGAKCGKKYAMWLRRRILHSILALDTQSCAFNTLVHVVFWRISHLCLRPFVNMQRHVCQNPWHTNSHTHTHTSILEWEPANVDSLLKMICTTTVFF